MSAASQDFQVFVKPIGSVCNLDCSYCYYLEKKALYPGAESLRMSDDVLEDYIAQHIAACSSPTVQFAWHGGEPTVLGIPYFRRIVELQRKHLPPGKTVINGIQTNGTLLDDEWGRFLSAEGFFVGISLDGPPELHDACRVTRKHGPTHEQVMNGYRVLQNHRIRFDVLCVVHAYNACHPQAVYRFFKEIGASGLTFLPLVTKTQSGAASTESVGGEAWGEFLCTIFDEWIRSDVASIYVQLFDEAARPLLGLEHSLCVLRPTCGELPVLEHNGDFYSCDHFVNRDHFLGNIRDKSLSEVLNSPAQRAFGQNKRESLPQSCRRCKLLEFCNGGCPKDRIVPAPEGGPPLNHLCAGYKRFFTHTRPYLQRLATFLRNGKSASQFADLLRAEEAGVPVNVSRNSLCACGSGLKYKRCCMGKSVLARSARLASDGQ